MISGNAKSGCVPLSDGRIDPANASSEEWTVSLNRSDSHFLSVWRQHVSVGGSDTRNLLPTGRLQGLRHNPKRRSRLFRDVNGNEVQQSARRNLPWRLLKTAFAYCTQMADST